MVFTKELLETAKGAGSAEELLELAKAEGMELTAEDAEKAFAELHKSGELADDELDNVAGGCYDPADENYAEDGIVDNEKDVVYRIEQQSHVKFYYPMMVRSGRITFRHAWRRNDGRYEPAYDILEDDTGERFTVSQGSIILS